MYHLPLPKWIIRLPHDSEIFSTAHWSELLPIAILSWNTFDCPLSWVAFKMYQLPVPIQPSHLHCPSTVDPPSLPVELSYFLMLLKDLSIVLTHWAESLSIGLFRATSFCLPETNSVWLPHESLRYFNCPFELNSFWSIWDTFYCALLSKSILTFHDLKSFQLFLRANHFDCFMSLRYFQPHPYEPNPFWLPYEPWDTFNCLFKPNPFQLPITFNPFRLHPEIISIVLAR